MGTATIIPAATPGPTNTPAPTTVPPLSDVLSESLSKVDEATSSFISGLPLIFTRLLFAAAVVLIGLLVLRFGRKLISRIIHKKEQDVDRRTYRQRETLRSVISSVFGYLMYFIIATVVLSIFGVDVSSLLAVAGVGGIAIGFGAQTLIQDIISGIFIWAEGNVNVKDQIVVNGLTGIVEVISLRTTKIRDNNGDLYVIPNGDIRTVTNESRGFKRAIVNVRVSYDDKIQHILDVLKDEMQKSEHEIPGLREAPQVVGITDMATDGLVVQVSALCSPVASSEAERQLRLRIKKRFEEEGIQFPRTPILPTESKEG